MIKFKSRKKASCIICSLSAVMFFAVAAFGGDVPLLMAKKGADKPKVTMPRYQETLQKAMDKLFGVLESIEKEKGISEEEKEKKAIEFVRNLRWGPEKKDYFWINTLQGKMLVDPYIPDLEGKDLIKFEDQKGKKVFLEFTKTCNEKGQGFVNYFWPKYEGKRPVPKVSLVRLFKPWGWVVGTGIYKDTIEAYEMPERVRFYVPLGSEPPLPDANAPASGT